MAGKKTIEEWEKLFDAADQDKSGELDLLELRDLLRNKGKSNMTDSQIAEAFIFFDGDKGDRKISKEEFIKGLKNLEDFIRKLTGLFRQYDTDNSGFLERNELRQVLCASGHKFTDVEVNDILRQADRSGDGKISFDEFFNACT